MTPAEELEIIESRFRDVVAKAFRLAANLAERTNSDGTRLLNGEAVMQAEVNKTLEKVLDANRSFLRRQVVEAQKRTQ